jgi:Tfp pilus assembly protein PilO
MKASASDISTKLASRKIELSCLAGFILGAIALYYVGIEPMQADHGQYQEQLEQMQQQRVQSAQLQARRRELDKELAEVRERLRQCPMRLQSYSQINTRVARINRIACNAELAVDEIQLGQVRDFDRYRTVGIAVKGRGAYPNLVSALREIRQAYPDTALAALEIRGEAGKTELAPAFQMQLVWYAARSQAQAAAGGQP